MNDKRHDNKPILGTKNSILDDVRQLWFPVEFRIAAPGRPLDTPEPGEADLRPVQPAQAQDTQPASRDTVASSQLVAELASCLWYLKTKHFKLKWDDAESSDDDPRVRRALGRLNKAIQTLKDNGIEVQDPTNMRYPAGGEGMMRPIQFLPTDGLTIEIVSETVAPIIYRDDRLVQRGEVFVAVPKREPTAASEAAPTTPSTESTAGVASVKRGLGDAPDESQTDHECSGPGVEESPRIVSEPEATPTAEPDRNPKKHTCSRKRTRRKN